MVLEGPLLAEVAAETFITATLPMRAFMEERQVAMRMVVEVLVTMALEHHMAQVLVLLAVE
jgi:hypothetical protein